MVVQRSNANQAVVQVAGSYSQLFDSIQVRAIPRVASQGTDTNWQRLTSTPTGGQFSGTVTIKGGWYRLQVRGYRNGAVTAIDSVSRFGVGEVFAIMGHSNAQGGSCPINGVERCPTIGGAIDDRVTCVSLDETTPAFQQYLNTASSDSLPGLSFAMLTTYSGISPFAQVSWFWGRMGDLLVQRINVPVLIYNASFGGSNMEQTYKAANDIPFEHSFIKYSLRMPYVNIRNIMNLYVPSTGIRAVLVHHGENDRSNPTDSTAKYYFGTIDKTRQESNNPDLPFVIALSSFVGGSFDNVRQAQTQVISRANYKTFLGPDIDLITSGDDRPDGLHFSPSGQQKAAQLWSDALASQLMGGSLASYPATPQPLATLACGQGDALQITLTPDQAGYLWSNGGKQQSQTLPAGRYSARQRDSQNRVTFPPAIQIPTGVQPPTPTIAVTGSLTFCRAGDLTLTSSYTGVNRWSSGATTQQLFVGSAGTYTVQAQNPVYGCLSSPSAARIVAPGSADLAVTLTPSQPAPAAGQILNHRLQIQNNGPCDATHVVWQNRLPSQLSATTYNGATLLDGVLSGTVVNIPSFTTYSFDYQVRPTVSGIYQNEVQLVSSDVATPYAILGSGTSDGEKDMAAATFRTRDGVTTLFRSPDPNPRPLPAPLSNQPTPDSQKADLSLVVLSNSHLVRAGQQVVFTITINNRGGLTATNVGLQHQLPTGIQFVSSPSGLTAMGGVVSGRLGQVAAGQTLTLAFIAQVASGTAPGRLMNGTQITASDQPDPNSTPNNGFTNGEDDAAQLELRIIP